MIKNVTVHLQLLTRKTLANNASFSHAIINACCSTNNQTETNNHIWLFTLIIRILSWYPSDKKILLTLLFNCFIIGPVQTGIDTDFRCTNLVTLFIILMAEFPSN
jgi:hypothetical protein